ncbi:hypothetical protein ACA910_008342 [Epithemia clementina (nom. ined.)]
MHMHGPTKQNMFLYSEIAIDGTLFRAHPFYQSDSQWYDWCLVKWEDDWWTCKKWYRTYSLLQPAQRSRKEILVHLAEHVKGEKSNKESFDNIKDGNYYTYYVPAKILGFNKDSEEDKARAIIHSCESTCSTNSLLTRKWQLKYTMERICSVPVSAIVCPVFIVEDTPEFHDANHETFV